MTMDRRQFLQGVAAVSSAAFGMPALAQALAGKQLRFVVAYPAGGVADYCARVAADTLRTSGATVVVENRPGAAGNIGLDYVVRQAGDSGVFAVFANSLVSTNPFVPQLASKTANPAKDVVPVAGLADLILVLAVTPQLGVTSVEQFLTKARTPNAPLRIGLAGTGTPHHLSALLLEKMAGLNLILVPYKGGAPMIADAAGGHLDAVITTVPVGNALVGAGKLRWLAVVQPNPVKSLPGIPSLAPVLKSTSIPSWIGVWAPAGTPPETVSAMNTALSLAVNGAEVATKLRDNGLEPINLSVAELESRISEELKFMQNFLGTIKVDFQT